MKRAEVIENLIEKRGYQSKKQFAEKIDIPYTTLHSILKRGIGNASIDNIIKICNGLNVTVEELQEKSNQKNVNRDTGLNDNEKEALNLFRQLPKNYKYEIIGEMKRIIKEKEKSQKKGTAN